nr:uncharacterized mitochondrial protein AtMg00810-like [Tanacetum cinerariifolium]
MRADELHKFNDGMLNDVRSALHDIAAGIRMEYPSMRKWSNLDKKRARESPQAAGMDNMIFSYFVLSHFSQNQRNQPRHIPLDSVVVLRYEKRKIKGKVITEMELVPKQTQQGSIYTDQRGTMVMATVFDEVTKTLSFISVDNHKPKPAEKEPANYALMAFSSSSSSFNNEVVSCSKACTKAYAQLQSHYDKLTFDFQKSQFDVISYQTGLESVEARLLIYKQNESVFEKDIKLPKLEVQLRDNALVSLRQNLKKAEQERDDLKLKFQSSNGYHAVPSPYTGTFMPPKPDLVFNNAPNGVETDHSAFTVKLSPTKPDQDIVPSFVQSTAHIKSLRPSVQHVKTSIPAATLKPASPKPTSNGKRMTRKACFMCKSLDHLIKDCNYHEKKMAQPTVSTDVPKFKVTRPRHVKPVVTKFNSPTRQPINHRQSPKASNSPPRVTTVQAPVVSAAQGNMSYLSDFEELNSGYVTFGGYPKGGKSSEKGKIRTGKLDFDDVYLVKELKFNLFSMPDESQVLLGVPKKNNMYNVNLKNIVPSGVLTCLFAKATIDESNLWHRRLGHINFKTMNKLVKDDYSRFNWVFFLATKDETSPILNTFITGLENQLSLKVKVIRSDNETKFKNYDLNQFCGMKGIKRKFSVPTTPQQNGIAESKNRTLTNAARTMLADSLLPIPFWAEAVNTACKFDEKVDEGFLVGYYVSSSGPTWLFDIDTLTRTMNYQPVTAGNQSNPSVGFQNKFDAEKAGEESDQQYVFFPVWSSGSTNPQNTDGNGALMKRSLRLTKRSMSLKSMFLQAVALCQRNKMTRPRERLKARVLNNTFSVAGPSNADASLTHGKSSIIDASQLLDDPDTTKLEDITYSDNEDDIGAEADFNNLETSITVSPILTTRVHKDNLMTQIIGFEDPDYPDKVYKVVKALYGLHQAPRAWYETLANYLLENSFQRGKIDQTVFIKRQKGDILLVQIYMSSMGELTFFLGLQVKQKKDGIFISQDKYIAEILRKFGLTEGKSASTPINTEKPLLKDHDGKDVDVHTYRSMIGSLMYLTSSRADIMFAVCACARFQVTPKALHLHKVKRIFRYLKGKPHLGLWYLKDLPFDLVAYLDSDYAGVSLDRKSTTEGCQFLGCRLISWQCKKQIVVATSSTKAEYVVAASCCAQTTVVVKKVNDIIRLQALVDKKKVVVTEATIQDALRLDDAEGVECLPNEEIFAELARMGCEKPSTKLTFYKAFFSSQWKFMLHTILQCMSAKRTSWNEFSSSRASAVIYLSSGRKFNFSKYIFDSLVRNVDSPTKFYMYPRFLQLMIRKQIGDLSTHTTKYTSPALTQKVFVNMRRVGKRFFGVETPLFEGMLVAQEVGEGVDDEEHDDGFPATGDTAEGDVSAAQDKVHIVAEEASIPSPTPPTPPPQPS